MEDNYNIIELLLFELIERCVRFYQHLDKIKEQFYRDADKNEHKLFFISSYKECIMKFLEIGEYINNENTIDSNKKLEILNKCIQEIQHLHKNKLGHLPKPSEPNELRRFNRIINKQIDKFNQIIVKNGTNTEVIKKKTSIFMTEDIGEETFKGDPLESYKRDTINGLINDENVKVIPLKTDVNTKSYHITIPRIDTYNACRWPTLLHEVGHHLYNKQFFKGVKIDIHFKNTLNKKEQDFILSDIEPLVNLENWLKESWCDLFATVTMGPALWFSQYLSFVFNGNYSLVPNEKKAGKYQYPPPDFRLKLIKRILRHRFPNTIAGKCREIMLDNEKLIMHFDKNFNDKKWVRLFQIFEKYFLLHFFTRESTKISIGTDQFNEVIEPLLKYTKSINYKYIKTILKDLESGLPIPTKRPNENEIIEEVNSIQEILLAAWIFRNRTFKERIFKLIEEKPNKIKETFEYEILKEFSKFDEIVLKSIQITEWATELIENFDLIKRKEFIKKIEGDNSNLCSQLVDFEIYNIIKSKELRIIPLIDPKQIGTTSIDIRLGTSFQIYHPNQEGILDCSNEKSILSSEISSTIIDIDFIDTITIAPKQFMLAHSMEYLDLPDFISAELDGRSSFARSGLQIHMTAGFVEPGFVGVLTYEIFNAGPNPIRLFPGLRIGQLRFIPVEKPKFSYRNKRDAKYKGLLSHYRSKQDSDDEVSILSRAKDKLS